VAEVLLFSALLMGVAVFGHFYIKEINGAERSQRMATLYADLLMHDISNYHQALALCLGLLETEAITPEQRKRTLRDANTDLMRADQLVRNVRRMGMIEDVDRGSFHPVDLVVTAEEAFEVVSRSPLAEGFVFSVTRKRGECYALANALLTDVFLNLFTNSVQYSEDEKSIIVDFAHVTSEGREVWQVSITDRGSGIEPELKPKLFQRYMSGAHRTGLGLSVVKALVDIFAGQIEVRDRIEGDHSKGTVFILTIPAYPFSRLGPPSRESSDTQVRE
jgi:signal transduction histidine kinase